MNQEQANISNSKSIYRQGKDTRLLLEDIEHMRHFKYRKVKLQEDVEYVDLNINVRCEDSEDEEN